MRPAWGRLAGQALCAGDELETESLLHQLSNAAIYVGLSTAEGDSLTICNANQPHNTSNGIVRNGTENSVIKITHNCFSFLGKSIVFNSCHNFIFSLFSFPLWETYGDAIASFDESYSTIIA